MIMSKPTKHALHFNLEVEPSLTEQEHLNSCDINIMIRDVNRGIQVRGSNNLQYGYDDTTLDGVQFRIQKQQLESELSELAQKHEFSPEELKLMSPDIQKRFKFKAKPTQSDPKTPAPKNDDSNDDKKAGPSDPKSKLPNPS